MLVPHSTLWRGVCTRGPEQACSSSRYPAVPSNYTGRRSLRRERSVDARAYEPTVTWQLTPTSRSLRRNGATTDSTLGPGSGEESGEDDGKQSRDRDGQQAVTESSTKVLKINIDLLLWRSRTARIRAQLTLDQAERRSLLKAAEDGLRRCLALDPSDPRTYVVLGKTLLQQKRYDEARILYQNGCANTGNTNPYIWSAWGWLEAQTGNVDRARKLYDAAVVVDGTHACAWHKWGMLEKSQGNYTRARDLWMQGIQRCRRKPQSQNAYLYCALGCMAAQLGRVGEARSWFEEGTRTAEGAASVALWQAWGVLEATQGDASAVRYLFRKALGANPRSRYVHLAWALWEKKQGNLQQCVALLRRGCQLNPTDPALYQAWAVMEKQAGRHERARILFEQGLKANPSYLYLWQAYGVMEAELGNMERARQLFQEGVWADPRSPSTVYIFHAWGSLEYSCGNVSTARELFKAAVRVDPKNETTWTTWITMETELGFLERADELRIRQAEQQWEFVVPAGFTTRPAPGLMDTLARFFTARGFGGSGARGSGSGDGAAAGGPVVPAGADDTPLRIQDLERAFQEGDLSLLPNFVSEDDDVEASLRPPPQGQGAARPRRPASAPAASPAAAEAATAAAPTFAPAAAPHARGPSASGQATSLTPPPRVQAGPRDTVDLAPRPVPSRARRRSEGSKDAGSLNSESLD